MYMGVIWFKSHVGITLLMNEWEQIGKNELSHLVNLFCI